MSFYFYNTVWIPAYNTVSLTTDINSSLVINGISLNKQVVTSSINSIYATTATNAVSNSFGLGIPAIQAGTTSLLSSATGSLITFNKAMPNANYAVSLTPSGSTGLTGSRVTGNRTTTGFTASFDSFSGNIHWLVVGAT